MEKMNRRLIRKIAVYAVITFVVFLPGSVKYWRLSRQKGANEAKLKALMEENRRLTEENKKLREDPVYIEKIARENLGLAKEGEFVVKFKDRE